MGTGISGLYYTTRGSSKVHHQGLIHSLEGKYKLDKYTHKPSRLAGGGHGQATMDFMDKNGIKYNVVKIYKNGVRVGNVPNHTNPLKQKGTNQSWFPKEWTQKDIVKAAEHVSRLKKNRGIKDGFTVWGKYKGVWVGIKKTHGIIATVFPDSNQSDSKRR